MLVLLGLLLIGAAVVQWFTQEAALRIWGPWKISFHRDEWPAFYWIVMALQICLGALLIYWSLS